MSSDTQYGRTLFLESFAAEAHVKTMERLHFGKNGSQSIAYDEAWLQDLIMKRPDLLPLEEIEPAFEGVVPVCVELPSTSGFLDNLLITPDGNIVLIECKLWRNPESRREVMAQIIDYANALSTWTYEKLNDAVKQAGGGNGLTKKASLYELVSSSRQIDEPSFIDAVSRNLKRGRFLLLILGDGIREGVESMTEFLQQHAGLHFTLALVEIGLFRLPTTGYVVQPRVLAKTTNIDRGVVSIEEGRISVKPPAGSGNKPSGRITLTKELFFETLEKSFPGITDKLNVLIDRLAEYNVLVEFGSNSMILRWHPDSTKGWNLGTIASNGDLWLSYLLEHANSRGLLDIATEYLRGLANAVPGATVKQTPKIAGWYVSLDGRNITIDALIRDDRRLEGWLTVIQAFQASVAMRSQGN